MEGAFDLADVNGAAAWLIRAAASFLHKIIFFKQYIQKNDFFFVSIDYQCQ